MPMKSKILSIVLSALVAVGLWLYVVTVESPGSEKTYYNIPVVLQNENILEERGLMITSELPKVSLTLSGTRTDLNKLDENNINILVNAASIEAVGTHQLSFTVSYPGSVSSGDITRVGQSISMITVSVEKRSVKNVDVVMEYAGSVKDGYIADKENILLDYDTIKVSGPESVVSQITQAKIKLDITDRTSTLMGAYSYELCDQNGNPVDAKLVTTNVEKVNVTLKIQQWKELPLKVKPLFSGGLNAQNTQIKISPSTILVAGNDVKDLNEILLEVDFAKLLKTMAAEMDGSTGMAGDQTLYLPIELPDGVTNKTSVTEAEVKITFTNVKIKKLQISKFDVRNIPEGMNHSIAALDIVVAGPAAQVDRITANDITATVDFSNTQSSAGMFPVTVEVGSAFSGVGVAGTYTVSATLG